jgi:hypothetical protein
MNGDAVQTRGFVSRLSSFTGQPFSSQMDLTGWVLFLGLIIVVAFLWTRVLKIIVEHV